MVESENIATAEKVTDLRYLADTMGGNKKLMREVMDVFLKQAPEELFMINEAVKKTDYTAIRNLSHTMKSSASIMGISSLSSILKEIEELAKKNSNIERIKELNNTLSAIGKQAIHEIETDKSNYV